MKVNKFAVALIFGAATAVEAGPFSRRGAPGVLASPSKNNNKDKLTQLNSHLVTEASSKTSKLSSTESNQSPKKKIPTQLEFILDEKNLKLKQAEGEEHQNKEIDTVERAVEHLVKSKQIETERATLLVATVIGSTMMGPIMGCLLGLSAAYGSRQSGSFGDVTRGVGRAAMRIYLQAKQFNDQHNLLESCQERLFLTLGQHSTAKTAVEKATEMVRGGWQQAVDFNQRHDVIEKGIVWTGKSVEFLATQVIQQLANSQRGKVVIDLLDE